MRILRAIVEPATDLLAIGVADLFHRRGIGSKSVGDDLLRSAICLHDALEKLQRRSFVPLCTDHRLQDLAFVIDGAPELVELAVDLHEGLIQMPSPLRIATHVRPGRRPAMWSPSGSLRSLPSKLVETAGDAANPWRAAHPPPGRMVLLNLACVFV